MADKENKSARVIDFHSHVLPSLDDGSKSVDMTREILEETRRQKVKKMVASPHFYPDKMSLGSFVEKRERAAGDLLTVWDPSTCPFVYLGAEVAYYSGIGDSSFLSDLTIVGTNTLMIEMPFHKWSGKEISEILDITLSGEFNVLLAHIERYLSWQEERTLDRLLDAGVFIQSNAENFTDSDSVKKALGMVADGRIHVLGSDTHNTTTRAQSIGRAKEIIKNALGEEAIRNMLSVSKTLLEGAISIDQMQLRSLS